MKLDIKNSSSPPRIHHTTINEFAKDLLAGKYVVEGSPLDGWTEEKITNTFVAILSRHVTSIIKVLHYQEYTYTPAPAKVIDGETIAAVLIYAFSDNSNIGIDTGTLNIGKIVANTPMLRMKDLTLENLLKVSNKNEITELAGILDRIQCVKVYVFELYEEHANIQNSVISHAKI